MKEGMRTLGRSRHALHNHRAAFRSPATGERVEVSSPLPGRTSASPELRALPLAARFAPAAFTELAQPLPVRPAFPHGQAALLPSPKQYAIGGEVGAYRAAVL